MTSFVPILLNPSPSTHTCETLYNTTVITGTLRLTGSLHLGSSGTLKLEEDLVKCCNVFVSICAG